MIPEIDRTDVAWIDTDQMREIDRVMVDELGISLLQMMENAGRNLAGVVLAERPNVESVAVYSGSGGNGGGGLVAARHLSNAGVAVTVVLGAAPAQMSPVAAHQLAILNRLGVEVRTQPIHADIAIDALVGYGLRGELSDSTSALVSGLTGQSDGIVSLDVPSGVDATSGEFGSVTVRPDATLTLCLPKTGLLQAATTGRLYLADISVPPDLVERIGGGTAPPFRLGPVLLLRE